MSSKFYLLLRSQGLQTESNIGVMFWSKIGGIVLGHLKAEKKVGDFLFIFCFWFCLLVLWVFLFNFFLKTRYLWKLNLHFTVALGAENIYFFQNSFTYKNFKKVSKTQFKHQSEVKHFKELYWAFQSSFQGLLNIWGKDWLFVFFRHDVPNNVPTRDKGE